MGQVILYSHQILMKERHVALLKSRGVTSDRSETGVGKTPAILAAAKELGTSFAIVCPKTLISHWKRWCALMELKPMTIIGWESCKLGKSPRLYNPKNPGKKWLAEWPDTRVLVIFDEAHRAKSKKSQNSKMVLHAAEEGHALALLSATLIQNPLDLLGLAYPLKLIGKPYHAYKYGQRFGVGINTWGGYDDFSTRAQKLALYEELDKVGVRIKKSEICETMCIHRSDLVDSEQAATVRGIYDLLEKEIKELQAKGASALEEITKRLRARQAAELAKVPLFVEEAISHLGEGARVTIFFCFTASIEAAKALLHEKGYLCGVITGQTPLSERDSVIQSYCFGDLSVLVVNIAAGGEGISLHDQDGRFPRVGLLSIPESSTHLIQALGRNDRVGAKSVGLNRILFCAGTIEERVHSNLASKISDIETINDADLGVLSEAMK